MCDTSTNWHRQLLSGRRRFGGGVVSGTRAVDHQKIGAKQSLQSLERWPQKRSLTPFDHIFYSNTALAFALQRRIRKRLRAPGAARLALSCEPNGSVTYSSERATRPSCLPLSFCFFFFFDIFFLDRYLEVRWCELRSIHQPDGHRQSQQQRSAC